MVSPGYQDAEKSWPAAAPRIWKPVGELEQRVGYTIEQINHMRDVFGTRLRQLKMQARRDWRCSLPKVAFTKPQHPFTAL